MLAWDVPETENEMTHSMEPLKGHEDWKKKYEMGGKNVFQCSHNHRVGYNLQASGRNVLFLSFLNLRSCVL